MKSSLKFIALVLVLGIGAFASDFYSLSEVKRVEQDMYSARSGTTRVLIVTRYCYEYTYGEDAVLKYEPYSYDNKIIFDDNTSCDVEKVMAR